MAITIDAGYKSLIHDGEELCGDKVEIVNNDDCRALILADGMGSGVRANILATLTSKIIKTMMIHKLPLEELVATILKTLPISSVNNAAYSTFTIIQVFNNGFVYIAEYDNPECMLIRNGKLQKLPFNTRIIEGKEIREAYLQSQIGDSFVAYSDGCLYCGMDNVINYAWDWKALSRCAERAAKTTRNASQMAARINGECEELYGFVPTDDVTVGVIRITEEKVLNLLTGPPADKKDDIRMVSDFMERKGIHVVSGGSTSEMVARVLHEDIYTSPGKMDSKIPPTSKIKGCDLVTEGVVTLNKTVELLEMYCQEDVPVEFFEELAIDNGATRLACYLMDDCNVVHLYVGRATNEEYTEKTLPYEISARNSLVVRLLEVLKKMNISVLEHYF